MMKKLRMFCFTTLAVAALLFGAVRLQAAPPARAAENSDISVAYSEMITDGEFNNASGNVPKNPSSWTENPIKSGANAVRGVVDLTLNEIGKAASETADPLKVKAYEDAFVPAKPLEGIDPVTKAPFHSPSALLINNNAAAAFGYKSNSLSLDAGAYYRISVWINTCNFPDITQKTGAKQNSGAYIRLLGDIEATSGMINTKNSWQQVIFFVEGYSFKSSNVNLSLQVGDGGTGEDDIYLPAVGYAFFDAAHATPISRAMFLAEKNTVHKMPFTFIVDGFKNTLDGAIANAGFESTMLLAAPGDGWSVIASNGQAKGDVVNVNSLSFADVRTEMQISKNPVTPFDDDNILMLGSGRSRQGVYGVRSSDFIIERHKYYRASIFAYGAELSSGSASAKIVCDHEDENNDGVPASVSTSAPFGKWHGGWSEIVFKIAGSVFYDRTVYMELWFGSPDPLSPASGVVFFDQASLEVMSLADFNASAGTEVRFAAPASGSVDNGTFNEIDAYEEFGYPFAPHGWRGINIDDNPRVTAGIIATDAAYYETKFDVDGQEKTCRDVFGGITPPFGTSQNPRHMLAIWNSADTYSGYVSGSMSVGAGSYSAVTVSMYAYRITGAGATLLLTVNGLEVSKIDGIGLDGVTAIRDYTFLIAGGRDSASYTLSILLGEKSDFDDKLATGYLFVDLVTSSSPDPALFESRAASQGQYFRTVDMRGDQFGFVAPSDSYLKNPYNWSMIRRVNAPNVLGILFGTVDLTRFSTGAGGHSLGVGGITRDMIGETDKQYIMLLSSAQETSVAAKWSHSISFKGGDNYYRVSVSLKTVGIDYEKGAKIILSGDSQFENINTERRASERKESIDWTGNYINNFVVYEFYVNVESGFSSNLEIWLGGGDKKTDASGTVIVEYVSYEPIGEGEYAESVSVLDDEDTAPDNVFNVTSASAAVVDDVVKEPGSGINWWVVPTILFSLLMVVALGMIVVRRYGSKLRFLHRTRSTTPSYDRRVQKQITPSVHAPARDAAPSAKPEAEQKIRTIEEPKAPAVKKDLDDFDRFDD
ncbi:MAG: hypothetical protein FWE62_05210 [Firmicutes bacterium]|nr:hypothetical protein [Bacillota bacterium]